MIDNISQEIIGLCSNLFGVTKAEVKKSNVSSDKLDEIFDDVRKNYDYAKDLYSALLSHQNDKVRFVAAGCCLKLNAHVKKAEKVLKIISKENDNPSIRFSAEMTLEVWKEQGYL